MKLFEYQAKDLFKDNGIPVPYSICIMSPREAEAALEAVGLPCVLKCQVLSGGRGKAGLVKLVKEKEEAIQLTKEYFERIKNLRAVLIETAVDAAREIYLSIGMDPVSGKALLMGCAQGGVEIERLALNNPEAIKRTNIDLNKGLQPYQISDFAYTLGFRGEELKKASGVISALYSVFIQTDAELAEINPLFVRDDGEMFAGDAKLSIDDNSMFRQKAYEKDRSCYESDMAFEAAKEGIPYLEFDGDISLMCAGAGLANTVYDLVNFEGGKVANYLEFGGPNYMKAGTAMRLCLANKPKVVLIVTFGTIARADIMAEGIVQAMKDLQPDCPIIACLRGTGEERVEEIFSPVSLQRYTDTEEAVRAAVAFSRGKDKA